MDRRRFLSVSAGAVSMGYLQAAATPSAAADGGAKAASSPPIVTIDANRSAVEEAPRRTPVAADVDVLVVGGGPTGVGAALAAASEGAKTLVIERHGMLGGMWTAGLLNPLFEPLRGWWVERLVGRDENVVVRRVLCLRHIGPTIAKTIEDVAVHAVVLAR